MQIANAIAKLDQNYIVIVTAVDHCGLKTDRFSTGQRQKKNTVKLWPVAKCSSSMKD